VQTSLYSASKLAGESLISAYSEGYGFRGTVFRFVSILGERYTHGHVYDFVKKLIKDPSRLTVLGDGSQRKSYLYAGDSIEAMLAVRKNRPEKGFSVWNVGSDEHSSVLDSVKWITEYMKIKPELDFTGGKRGWAGDNPFIWLDISKLASTGWARQLTIKEAVERTVDWLLKNPSALKPAKL
jgi:UDP-glucose 4-epimerase